MRAPGLILLVVTLLPAHAQDPALDDPLAKERLRLAMLERSNDLAGQLERGAAEFIKAYSTLDQQTIPEGLKERLAKASAASLFLAGQAALPQLPPPQPGKLENVESPQQIRDKLAKVIARRGEIEEEITNYRGVVADWRKKAENATINRRSDAARLAEQRANEAERKVTELNAERDALTAEIAALNDRMKESKAQHKEIYVLQDGRRIQAISVIRGNGPLSIKDEQGNTHEVWPEEVREIVKPGTAQPAK